MKIIKSELTDDGDIIISISFSREERKTRSIKEEREKSDKELIKQVGKILMIASKHT